LTGNWPEEGKEEKTEIDLRNKIKSLEKSKDE